MYIPFEDSGEVHGTLGKIDFNATILEELTSRLTELNFNPIWCEETYRWA